MKIYFVLIVLVLSACGSKVKAPEAAPPAIAADKMQMILKDIHLADALANREGEPNGTTEALTKEYYQSVFEKHGVTSDAFYASMRYYTYEVNIIDSLYANVIVEISKEQALIQAE